MDASHPAPPATATARPRGRRWAPATLSVVAAIGGAWWYEVARFGSRPSVAELHVLGGLSLDAVRLGEFWRVPSGALLHASWRHVAVNVVGLLLVGWVLERRVGSRTVLATMALGCVLGAAGAMVQLPGGITVGASAVLFALLGLAAWRGSLLLRGAAAITVVVLVGSDLVDLLWPDTGGRVEVVSVGAHAGGALAGLLVGVATVRARAAKWVHRAGVATAAVLLIALMVGGVPMIHAGARDEWAGGRERSVTLDADLVERALVGFPSRSPVAVVSARCQPERPDRIACRLRERGGETASISFRDHAVDLALRQAGDG